LVLRDVGLFAERAGERGLKAQGIRRISLRFPIRLFLVGDSGQEDASIHADLARSMPERVSCILIPNVFRSNGPLE